MLIHDESSHVLDGTDNLGAMPSSIGMAMSVEYPEKFVSRRECHLRTGGRLEEKYGMNGKRVAPLGDPPITPSLQRLRA